MPRGDTTGVLHLLIGTDRDARERVHALLCAQLACPGPTAGSAAASAASTRTLTFDVEDPDGVANLAAQAAGRPLFASATLATLDLSAVPAAQTRSALAALADTGVTVAVTLARRPAPSLLQGLDGRYQEHDTAPPTPARALQQLVARCRTSPVAFEPEARRHLETLARVDVARALGVVKKLELAGVAQASLRQVWLLSGSAADASQVWQLADAVTRGRLGDVSELARRSDPVAAWAALGRLLCQLTLVTQQQVSRSQLHGGSAGGSGHPGLPGGLDSRLSKLLQGVGQPQQLLSDALALWVEQDRRIKADPQPPARLLAAAASLTLLFIEARPR